MSAEETIKQKILTFSRKELEAISQRLDSNSLEDKDMERIKEALSIVDDIGGLVGDRELVWRTVLENRFRVPE